MLTKGQALKLRDALATANKGSTKILSALVASKTGKITASAHKQYSKELKLISSIAAKAEKHLINAFATPADVSKASKIEAVEKLLVASAELSLRSKIMARVLADADELSELPDGDAEFVDAEDEVVNAEGEETIDAEGEDEIVDAEGEDFIDAEDEIVDDAEGEDFIDAEGDDEPIDAEDEDFVDAEDEVVENEPVSAKRKLARKIAKRPVSAKRALPRKISASAKMARRASATRPSLQSASRSLINWDFIPQK